MKNTLIIIGERTSVAMRLRNNRPLPDNLPSREVVADPNTVVRNLEQAGYTKLYWPDSNTVVVGLGERDVQPDYVQATLDTVCADALGPKPKDRHSSVAGVNSFHGGWGR